MKKQTGWHQSVVGFLHQAKNLGFTFGPVLFTMKPMGCMHHNVGYRRRRLVQSPGQLKHSFEEDAEVLFLSHGPGVVSTYTKALEAIAIDSRALLSS